MTARRNVLLLALVVGLFAATVVGGVLVWEADREREAAAVRQKPYGAVVRAARSHVLAVVNLRHDDPTTFEDARAGATGALLDDYARDGEVVGPVRRNRSVLVGSVIWAGVEELAGDEASALVATTGTVTSRQTEGELVTRQLRLRVHLVREDGRWLADDLELVA